AHVGVIDGSQMFVGPDFQARLTADGEHLDGRAYPYDLMGDTLAPSVRELPSALDTRILVTVRGSSAAQPGPSVAAGTAPGQTGVTTVSAPPPLASPLMGAPQGGSGGTPVGLVNADFHVTDPSDPNFGWTVRGAGAAVNGQAVLNEDGRVFTGFS